jgi:hypothetical protein
MGTATDKAASGGDTKAETVEAAVGEWFNDFRNGPLAANTELWNLVQARLPELISSIAKL